jgi:hypothetical protein
VRGRIEREGQGETDDDLPAVAVDGPTPSSDDPGHMCTMFDGLRLRREIHDLGEELQRS